MEIKDRTKRWLKRLVRWNMSPIVPAVELSKEAVQEGNPIKAVGKMVKRELEENPLTNPIYESIKYDGKVEGYAQASDEYEKKLLEQADEFIQQRKDYIKGHDEYEQLLEDYESKIAELESIVEKTLKENESLQRLRDKELELKALREI